MNREFKINGKVLETKRLILRPFEPADLEDFYEYASVEGVGEAAGWKHHESKTESRKILQIFMEEDHDFAVTLRETGKMIGSVGVKKYGREEALTEFYDYAGAELGAVLCKDYWGRGLMTEALEMLSRYLFEDLNYDFLLAGYYDFNERSRKMQEKLGFLPYRKLVFDTRLGTQESGVLNLKVNPEKEIRFSFSHPETLIWKKSY